MSQLLERLKSELVATSDSIQRSETSCRIAANLARLGRFSEAHEIVADVRRNYGQGQSGRVTVWLMLAEGITLHYEALSPSALERVRGAQVLGLAMKYQSFVALASAWKAHIEFERSQFDSMTGSIQVAVENLVADDLETKTRLAAVLSNSFLISGDRQRGYAWFRRGHDYAVRNGDQASIDALLYNRAAFVLAGLRVANCLAPVSEADLRAIRMEIASARNLQDLLRLSALEGHVRLLEARLDLLEGKYASAIDLLSATRALKPFSANNFDQNLIELEICFCEAMLGRLKDALGRMKEISSFDFLGMDVDERLAVSWLRLSLARLDGRFGEVLELQRDFESIRIEYDLLYGKLRSRLRLFDQLDLPH